MECLNRTFKRLLKEIQAQIVELIMDNFKGLNF
jgi:hypothetical protein